MPNIALNFEDGYTRIIDGWDAETVADAAYRQRINIPVDCGDGACGTCKCKVLSGDYDLGEDYIEDALSDEEAENGYALACQMSALSDVVVEVFANAASCKLQTESFATTVSAIEKKSAEIVKLTVTINDDQQLDFLPGQYANITIPGSEETRSYSFSSLPGSNSLEFVIRLLPDGLASNYLRDQAKVGDQLQLTAPYGSFYARKIERPTLFFAGGTGIAPFLSMLEKIKQEGGLAHEVQLFYGARSEENLAGLPLLNEMKATDDFDYRVCLSEEDSANHPSGFVTQWITQEELGASEYDVYICGPPAMVEAVKSAIDDAGIRLTNFYMEKFLPSGQ